jgi:hypothetical protein
MAATANRDMLRVLAAPAANGRLSPLAAGAAFVSAYSDGSSGTTNLIAVGEQATRFTVPDRTLSMRVNVPVALGNDMLARLALDASAGSVTVSTMRSVGTLGGASALSRDARQVSVRMSNDKSEVPLEFTVGFSGGVLTIVPKGATAQAMFAPQRDEALFRFIVGQAILDATAKLKAVEITAVRLIRPVL